MSLKPVNHLRDAVKYLHRINGLPGGSMVKNPPANAEDTGNAVSIPGSGRSPGEVNGNALQFSCLEKNLMDRVLVGYSPCGHKELGTTEHTVTQMMYKCVSFLFFTSFLQ